MSFSRPVARLPASHQTSISTLASRGKNTGTYQN